MHLTLYLTVFTMCKCVAQYAGTLCNVQSQAINAFDWLIDSVAKCLSVLRNTLIYCAMFEVKVDPILCHPKSRSTPFCAKVFDLQIQIV